MKSRQDFVTNWLGGDDRTKDLVEAALQPEHSLGRRDEEQRRNREEKWINPELGF